VANVWDALKKHKAEQASKAPPVRQEAVAEAPKGIAVSPTRPPGDRGSADGYSQVLVAYHDRGGKLTEAYRALRTNLLAQNPTGRFCYLVTSALPGEGKTVTCLNLGIVLAERVDRRTVIVDGDLRKGRIATLLSGEPTPGLAELLRGEAALSEIVRPTALPSLFYIPAGKAEQHEVGELMGRPELEEAVTHLRRQYDFVLLDAPPINVISDAGMLGRASGEALLVVRMHRTRRETVERAVALLHAADVKPAGVVLTHQKYIIPNYLYRYS